MAITLTPEQQTKLDDFEASAQGASEAREASSKASADLAAAELQADHTKALEKSTLVQALADAQEFIDSMIPPKPANGASPAGLAKKV